MNFHKANLITGTILILACVVSAPSSSQALERRESFLFYVNGGVALPRGEYGDRYKTGAHGGAGVGVVALRGPAASVELVFRFDYCHFSRKSPPGRITVSGDTGGALLGVESKFRLSDRMRPRPYGLMGIGVFDMGNLVSLGVGIDIPVNPTNARPLFIELSFVDANLDFIRLRFGIRLG